MTGPIIFISERQRQEIIDQYNGQNKILASGIIDQFNDKFDEESFMTHMNEIKHSRIIPNPTKNIFTRTLKAMLEKSRQDIGGTEMIKIAGGTGGSYSTWNHKKKSRHRSSRNKSSGFRLKPKSKRKHTNKSRYKSSRNKSSKFRSKLKSKGKRITKSRRKYSRNKRSRSNRKK